MGLSQASGPHTARSRVEPVPDPQETHNGAPEASEATVVEGPNAKRKPGRPKGSTKWPGSGRKKGTVNKSTAELRRYIHSNANPVAQVCKIAKGKVEIDGLSQADAIKLLYKAVIPELRGEVLTGEDGAPLIEPSRRDELYSSMELARRTAFMLRAGDDAQRELAAMDAPKIDTEPQLIPEPEPETATKEPESPVVHTNPPLASGDPKRRDRAVRRLERF